MARPIRIRRWARTRLRGRRFYDTDWYRVAWQTVKRDRTIAIPENNDALRAMQPYLNSDPLVIIDTSNELFALRADRFGREFGLNVVINGSGNEYRRLEDVRATGRTVIVPLDFPQPPNVATAESAMNVSLESLMHWDLAPENPGKLVGAGVPVVFLDRRTAKEDRLPDAVTQSGRTRVTQKSCSPGIDRTGSRHVWCGQVAGFNRTRQARQFRCDGRRPVRLGNKDR